MNVTHDLIPYLVAVLLLAITPGPTVVGVISLSVQKNMSFCYKFIFGILTANLIFIILAAFIKSMGFVLPDYFSSFMVIVGSLGLFYLGGRMAYSIIIEVKNEGKETILKTDSTDYFLMGFFHHSSNTNTVAFFLSIFLSIVPLDDNFVRNVILLGGFTIVIDAVVLIVYSQFTLTAGSLVFRDGSIVKKLPIFASFILIYLAVINFTEGYSGFFAQTQ